jgi:hypothetical protein
MPDVKPSMPEEPAASATPLPAEPAAPVEAAPARTLPRSRPACPECGARVEPYTGDINPHKLGTGWCETHGRVRLS